MIKCEWCQRILNTAVLACVLYLWSAQSDFMARFVYSWFMFFFLGLVVMFKFFNSHFPVTPLGLDLFSGTHLDDFTVLWCPVTENGTI